MGLGIRDTPSFGGDIWRYLLIRVRGGRIDRMGEGIFQAALNWCWFFLEASVLMKYDDGAMREP